MSLFVKHEGRIWPRMIFEPPLNPPPGECVHCGGTGRRLDTIDSELPDVVVACDWCQEYCKACDEYVKKGGHECKRKGARP